MPETDYKTREELEERIKAKLGFPVVEVELEQTQIDAAIDEALEDIDGYINETMLISRKVPRKGRIDLSDEPVDFVTQVYKTPSKEDTEFILIPYSNIENYQMLNRRNVGIDFRSRVFRHYLNKQVLNTIKDPVSFRWEEPYLYLEQGFPKVNKATIEFVPYMTEVNHLPKGKWWKMVRRLALAKAKYMLGRIRGKYDAQNSPFDMDGDDLIQEGKEEEEEILEKLEQDADVFYPI